MLLFESGFLAVLTTGDINMNLNVINVNEADSLIESDTIDTSVSCDSSRL